MYFGDGEHIIYVNGAMRSNDTALGRLMNVFYCTDVDDMCYKELSDRVRYFKNSKEGFYVSGLLNITSIILCPMPMGGVSSYLSNKEKGKE